MIVVYYIDCAPIFFSFVCSFLSPFSFHLSVFTSRLLPYRLIAYSFASYTPIIPKMEKIVRFFFIFFHFFFIFLKRFTIKSDSRLSIQSKNDVNNAFFRIKTCMYSQKILPLQRKLELFTS